jgi:ribose transport system substrate-binding protein
MNFEQQRLIKPITKPLKFVFIPKSENPWYDVVKEGAEDAIEKYKRLGIQIQLIWDAPPIANVEAHTKIIETHIRTQPDGVAIACLAPTTNTRSINNAIKTGLHVITFDTDAPESSRKIYIGHDDDYQDGHDLADFLADRIGGRGEVGILTGTLTAPNHAGRVKGFKDGIAHYKGIKVVFTAPDSDDLENALHSTEMALKTHPDMTGFFCCNATNPIGCARAVKAAGKAGQVHVVGMDLLPETVQFMKEGIIDGVKMQRQREIGYWSIEYMVALNQGHTIPQTHRIGSILITKEEL